MKAVVKARPEVGIDVMDMPMPEIKLNEALVEIKACGICGSDVGLYEWRESDRYRRGKLIPLPVIIGHEPAGVVLEVGSEVTSVKVGDRVASDSWGGCGYCHWCRMGYFNYCREGRNIGSLAHGAMARYCAIPFFSLNKIPNHVSFEEAAAIQPLGVAMRSIEQLVNFKPGDDALVMGCGPIGLMEATLARLSGAANVFIVGLSVDKKRLEMAREFGFSAINAEEQSLREVVMDATDGLGVDVVFDATSSGAGAMQGMDLLKPTGQLQLTAVIEGSVSFSGKQVGGAAPREITIRSNYARNPSSMYRAIKLVSAGRVDLKPLITHRFRVEQAEEAFQTCLRREGMKALIIP